MRYLILASRNLSEIREIFPFILAPESVYHRKRKKNSDRPKNIPPQAGWNKRRKRRKRKTISGGWFGRRGTEGVAYEVPKFKRGWRYLIPNGCPRLSGSLPRKPLHEARQSPGANTSERGARKERAYRSLFVIIHEQRP